MGKMTQEIKARALGPGARVDRYTIERQLGGGGFSIVYLANDPETRTQVIVKEYMPRRLAARGEDGRTVITVAQDDKSVERFAQGKKMFFQEAATLATLKHPNIVNVTNFFRANGTVYMVMEYEQGINLQEYIRRHNGSLSEKLIRIVSVALLDGLKCIHSRGLLHLDIKPGNIYLRNGGKPLLLDFGAVHEMIQSRQDQASQVITPGFSPIEQLTPGGYVGPWSDIYAVGATMRACIEGVAPPPSPDRTPEDPMKPAVLAFRKRYSTSLLKAIDWAMEVDPLARPQNVDQLLTALNDKDSGEPPAPESMLERLANTLTWGRS
jgi:serine/threonine protein kinase